MASISPRRRLDSDTSHRLLPLLKIETLIADPNQVSESCPAFCLTATFNSERARLQVHLGDNDAIDGRRRLVGAVGAPKLLDGLVRAPGQLQRQVAAPPPIGHPAATDAMQTTSPCSTSVTSK
jgi:hypothetical protein